MQVHFKFRYVKHTILIYSVHSSDFALWNILSHTINVQRSLCKNETFLILTTPHTLVKQFV
jgi:hypothetical protein